MIISYRIMNIYSSIYPNHWSLLSNKSTYKISAPVGYIVKGRRSLVWYEIFSGVPAFLCPVIPFNTQVNIAGTQACYRVDDTPCISAVISSVLMTGWKQLNMFMFPFSQLVKSAVVVRTTTPVFAWLTFQISVIYSAYRTVFHRITLSPKKFLFVANFRFYNPFTRVIAIAVTLKFEQ